MQLLQEQPKRMALEWRLLLDHERSTPAFSIQSWGKTSTGQLSLSFRLALLAGTFDGTLVYPDHFPDVPAYIRPQKPGEAWSVHQYGGSGVLCLQHGPDNWHPGITGVDLVCSAHLLLLGETLIAVDPTLATLPSRHQLTSGQDLRSRRRRFLATEGLRKALANLVMAPVELKAVVTHLGGSSVVVVTALGHPLAPVAGIPGAFAEELFEWSGWAVPVPSLQAVGAIDSAESLKAALGVAWPCGQALDAQIHFVLLHDANGGLRVMRLDGGVNPLFCEYHVVDFTTDNEQRLPAAFGRLSDTTVAIVGLGSLGSKIAISLARAGVRRFILVDDDVLAPQNLVRNELNWFDVGFSKVDGVSRALKRIAPEIAVATQDLRVAGQENPLLAASLSADLTKCNLLIDATANPQAFVALAALAKRGKISMVWGEVFGGGGGAMMARSRPDRDANPLSIRAHILGVMATMAPVDERKGKNYEMDADGRVYVAGDADVTALAASMTQFALDIVCPGEESVYPVAAYLMGYRKHWEFKGPFDTIPIDCTGAMQTEPPPHGLTEDEIADLDALTAVLEADSIAADNHTR